jgi:hypothetical protein
MENIALNSWAQNQQIKRRGYSENTQKEAGFTPGPWKILNSHKVGFHNVVHLDESGELTKTTFICETGASTEAFANARLIAAAPELYEACQLTARVMRYLTQSALPGESDAENEQLFQSLPEIINAAIANATGTK